MFKIWAQFGKRHSFLSCHRQSSGRRIHQTVHVSSYKEERLSYNLTRDEALCFVEDVLQIPSPENLINFNKEFFIKDFVRQVNLKIPFTNMPFITAKGAEPMSLDQCKESMFTRQGGNCVLISSFVKAVIELLGIDCYIIGGSLHSWKSPTFDDHFAVVVQNVTFPDSLHLLDLGTRYFFEPVSLDFNRVSSVYQCRHFPYRLFHVSYGVVQLCRERTFSEIETDLPRSMYIEDDQWWEVLTTFRIFQPKSLFDGLQLNRLIIEDASFRPLSGSDMLLYGYPNGLLVNINTKKCLTMSRNGHREETRMTSHHHVIETVQKYFPQFSFQQVEAVINHFSSNKPVR